jgi:hypothetical protein
MNLRRPMVDLSAVYPVNNGIFANIMKLSCRDLRLANSALDPICVYKSGMILDPGEVMNWTGRLRRLTSVRHRATILRIAHGDIYTNQRLHNFGLVNDPKCCNCDEPVETLSHKFLTCPKVREIWSRAKELKNQLSIETSDLVTFEDVLGVNETSKLGLAINAEILKRILSASGKVLSSSSIINCSMFTLEMCEPMEEEMRIILRDIRDLG